MKLLMVKLILQSKKKQENEKRETHREKVSNKSLIVLFSSKTTIFRTRHALDYFEFFCCILFLVFSVHAQGKVSMPPFGFVINAFFIYFNKEQLNIVSQNIFARI